MTSRQFFGELLNILLHVLHIFIIIFSLTGWLFDRTRAAHFLLLLATLAYWYLVGPALSKKGWFGHCLVTDLQWELKKRLGHDVPAAGYIQYLADRLAGHATDAQLVDRLSNRVLLFCLAASAFLLLMKSCATGFI